MRIDLAFQKQKEGKPLSTGKSRKQSPVKQDSREHKRHSPPDTDIGDVFGNVESKPPPLERVTSADKVTLPIKRQKVTLASDAPRYDRPGLLHWQDVDDIEVVLRKWDLDLKYGPCIGLSRLERWQRAKNLGIDPPDYVHTILTAAADNPDIEPAQPESLWAAI